MYTMIINVEQHKNVIVCSKTICNIKYETKAYCIPTRARIHQTKVIIV